MSPVSLLRRTVLRLLAITIPLALLPGRAAVAADPRLDRIWRCGEGDCPGYEYDPGAGDPERGIAPGTAFEDLPEDWYCAKCGGAKRSFRMLPPRG